ncbi:hypothetical protein JAO29_18680 [Edaphobacter sp. HDX4]|uniref:hypothetical protein n=1 Tax=Edaphobacter sp. HDX4 TaxID=2794064 RepID=UPI002FE5D7DA
MGLTGLGSEKHGGWIGGKAYGEKQIPPLRFASVGMTLPAFGLVWVVGWVLVRRA